MSITIKPSKAIGSIDIISSKSYAHRILIASLLTNHEVIIHDVNMCNDLQATINALKTFGKTVEINNNTIIVSGNITINKKQLVIDCLESGSTLRFLIPLCIVLHNNVILKGTKKLISRGISVYEDIFKEQNINYVINSDSIYINGSLKPGTFNIRGDISSQFITGLLFALPLLNGDSTINITSKLESKNYIDITLDVLKQAQIDIFNKGVTYYIKGSQKFDIGEIWVEKDYSNACFLDVYNYIGGNVKINGLNENSLQGDKVYNKLFNELSKKNTCIDIKDCIDLGPILFCFSALKHGGHFINTKRLTIKESNRIDDLKKELEKFNVLVITKENEVIIDNTNIQKPNNVLYSHNDHRLVMALTTMLSVYGGVIEGENAVSKSYPNYFIDIEKLGIEVIKNE